MEKILKKLLPVNWTDGMKINKNHLVAERNALQHQAILAAGSNLSDVNYGLLPPVAEGTQPFKMFASLDNQQHLQVRLLNCRAITPGGVIIDVNESDAEKGNLSILIPNLSVPVSALKSRTKTYYVVLTVNIYDREPFGQADPEEIPPRLPWAVPLYSLNLIAEEHLSGLKIGLYHLTIARIMANEQRVQVDDEYIPPSTVVASHSGLIDVFYGLEEFFSKMELYALQINQKIEKKKQNSEMALIVQKLCDNLQLQLSHLVADFKWLGMQHPPVQMFAKVAAMARLIKNTLDIYVHTGKEELMNYFSKWCGISQDSLEMVIIDLGNHKYRHEDINVTVLKVMEFTKIISSLFHKLSRLDYIGDRNSNIFVKEEIVAQEKNPEPIRKSRKNFLAD